MENHEFERPRAFYWSNNWAKVYRHNTYSTFSVSNLYYCYCFYSKSNTELVKTLVINIFTVPLLACIYFLPEMLGI